MKFQYSSSYHMYKYVCLSVGGIYILGCHRWPSVWSVLEAALGALAVCGVVGKIPLR